MNKEKKMKRILYITSGLMVVFSLLAFAGCREGFGPGCFGDPGKMIDKQVKDLNLTQSQKAQLESIKKNIASDMKAHRERMQSFHSEIDKAIAKGNPDINALAADIKTKIAAEPNPGVKMVDYFTQFYNTLDAKQQKMLLEKIKAWEKDRPCKTGWKGCHSKSRCPYSDDTNTKQAPTK